uniref:ATP synthase subunit a n=1 Tax=Olavius algarvensis TaxID=188229 RepID=A0A7R9RDM5_9ANNE|nr:ATP6 CDS [Olavius algarvensis]CAD7857583.1 ATP6 CDS [Olavius algarvensis]
MLMNMFSMFDPMWFNLCYKNLIILLIILMQTMTMFWLNNNKMMIMLMPAISYIMSQLMKTKMKNLKSASMMISSLFILIMYLNISGMFPYMFSTSSHISLTISMGLSMWLLFIMSSATYSMKKTMAHLLPDSSPSWLSPFLILIESTSIMVRPLTLSFRLAANMTAGHVILSLISSFSINMKMSTFMTMLLLSMMYILFELGICIIQSYIFCLLISLYSNDHP